MTFDKIYEQNGSRIEQFLRGSKQINDIKPCLPNDRPIIFSFTSIKGGSGKTTDAYTMAYVLGNIYPERKVIMVDLDLKTCSLSYPFLLKGIELSVSSFAMYISNIHPDYENIPFDKALTHVSNNLYLVGSRTNDQRSEFIKANSKDYLLLRNLIYSSEVIKENPIIIIDAGSSKEEMELAMKADDFCIVPVDFGAVAISGFSNTLHIIKNNNNKVLGLVPAFYDKHYQTGESTLDDLQQEVKNSGIEGLKWLPPIPRADGAARSLNKGIISLTIMPFIYKAHLEMCKFYKSN
jgi:cellulose biosynthesis protein BcsQ